MAEQYQVILTGDLVEGVTREQVVSRLSLLFKQPPQTIDEMLSGEPVPINQRFDLARAQEIEARVRAAGAACFVTEAPTLALEPAEEPEAAAASEPTAAASEPIAAESEPLAAAEPIAIPQRLAQPVIAGGTPRTAADAGPKLRKPATAAARPAEEPAIPILRVPGNRKLQLIGAGAALAVLAIVLAMTLSGRPVVQLFGRPAGPQLLLGDRPIPLGGEPPPELRAGEARRTLATLNALTFTVNKWRAAHPGAADFEPLRKELGIAQRRVLDGWGRDFRLVHDGNRLLVRSPGADGNEQTADDITLVFTLN